MASADDQGHHGPPPLNLAGVQVQVDDSLIDPALHPDFFKDGKFDDELAAAAVVAAAQQHEMLVQGVHNVQSQSVPQVGDHQPQPGGVDGVNANLNVMGGSVMDVHGNVHGMNDGINAQMEGPVGPPPGEMLDLKPEPQQAQAGPSQPSHLHVRAAEAQFAPFSRPIRTEGQTPHPEMLAFTNRAEFDVWFEGESSWCHFVQRRTTTPQKRAEERLRARVKAHEKMLASLPPSEAATAPPLKRRRRNRTSSIKEKVTFTCHHAGRYEAKHSTTLPREKLRLNTKKSVKCDCPARIVLTEMEDGECKVSYFWKHEGHDAYADDELESGRLPKVIDEWLVAQIEAGKDTDAIRRSLMMTEEEKSAYLAQIAQDPHNVDPDKPPALALTLKVKYPDIYNRFRKLRGPIKDFKPPKNPRGNRKRGANSSKEPESGESATPKSGEATSSADAAPTNEQQAQAQAQAQAVQAHAQQQQFGPQPVQQSTIGVDKAPGTAVQQMDQVDQVDIQDNLMQYDMEGFSLSEVEVDGLGSFQDGLSHEGLARALLSLPRAGQDDGGMGAAGVEELNTALRMAEQDREKWEVGL